METEGNLKPILGSLAENTAMHGLPNIRRSVSLARRIFWTLIVLAGIAMIIYEVTMSVKKYTSYPVQTSISPRTAFSHPFPAITICNQNPIRQSALNRAGTGINALLQKDISQNSVAQAYTRTYLKDSVLKAYAQLPMENRMKIGHQIDTMLLDCSYGKSPCNYTYFTPFSNFYYGNCFTVNSGHANFSTFKATNVGPLHGFQVNLFIEQDQYIGSLAEAAGVRVVIHNQTHMPFPEDEGFTVAPGFLTYVGLTRREISRAPHPYGDCSDKSDAANAYSGVLQSVKYSKMACKKTCLQYHVLKSCGCWDPVLEMNSTVFNGLVTGAPVPCINITAVECNGNVRTMYERNKLNCSQGCPPKCFETIHHRTVSHALWPADRALTDVVMQLNSSSKSARLLTGMNAATAEAFTRKNTLKIVIYFESLDFDYISTSSSFSGSDLAASFGGQMGLWLGVSVCTLFEVVEMFWDLGRVISQRISFRKNKTHQLQDNNETQPSDQGPVKRDKWLSIK